MTKTIIQRLIIISILMGGGFLRSFGEDALRDGNRNPTLLYDLNGTPKRVSNTSPLPVSGNLSVPTSNPIPITAPAAIPVISTVTLKVTAPSPLSVSAAGAFPIVSTQTLNVTAPNPLLVSETSTVTVKVLAPLPVVASGAFPITSSTTLNVAAAAPLPVTASNPLPMSIQNQTSTVAVTITNQNTPVPVSVINPIPASTTTVSIGSERIGPGTFTLITPSAGKRIAVRGVTIMMETSTGGEADVRFASGALIFKTYRGDQSCAVIPVYRDGNVNETVQAVTTGIAGGAKVFFVVNYEEK